MNLDVYLVAATLGAGTSLLQIAPATGRHESFHTACIPARVEREYGLGARRVEAQPSTPATRRRCCLYSRPRSREHGLGGPARGGAAEYAGHAATLGWGATRSLRRRSEQGKVRGQGPFAGLDAFFPMPPTFLDRFLRSRRLQHRSWASGTRPRRGAH